MTGHEAKGPELMVETGKPLGPLAVPSQMSHPSESGLRLPAETPPGAKGVLSVLPASPPKPPSIPPTKSQSFVSPRSQSNLQGDNDTFAVAGRRRATTQVSRPESMRITAAVAAEVASPAASMDPTSTKPQATFRRRTASLPSARLDMPGQITTARQALKILHDLKESAYASAELQATVSLHTLGTLETLVDLLVSRGSDSQLESQMKSKFLSMPTVYDADLQHFLLKEYTPSKTETELSRDLGTPKPHDATISPMVSPQALAPDDFAVKRLIRLSRASSSTADNPTTVARSPFEHHASTDAASAVVEADAVVEDLPPLSPPIDPSEDQIAALLSETVSWSFDVFQLANLCPGRVLTTLGLKLLQDHDLYNALGIEQDTVARFFGGIDAAYNPNPYHNSLHGADVGVSMNSLLTTGGMRAWMSPLQIFAALISAFAHDVAHPGVNNSFLVTTGDPLALKYNDISPLENMHVATVFDVASRPKHDVFASLTPDAKREARKTVIHMILATDNEMHFEHLAKVTAAQNAAEAASATDSSNCDTPSPHRVVASPKGQLMVLQLALHAADVSNPSKPWEYYLNWTERLITEFYVQGDRERDMGFTVTPMLDRSKPTPLPKFQAGFINAIVMPLYKELHRLDGVDVTSPLLQLQANLTRWNDEMASATA